MTLDERLGYQIGFTQQAQQLRERLGVPKSELKRNGDPSYYSRLLNGHGVPGWGEDTTLAVDPNALNPVEFVNKGRNQLKNYVKLLLQRAMTSYTDLSAGEVIEMVNNLLLAAEYAPLDAIRRQDDAALLNLIKKKYQFLSVGNNELENTAQIVESQLKRSLAEEIERLVASQMQELQAAGTVRVTLFKTGVPESDWHKRIRQVEANFAGERLYYGPALSIFATPPTVRQLFAQAQGWNARQTQEYLDARQKRLDNWLAQVQRFSHRDIYDMENLERELKERTFRGVRLSPNEVRARIETLIEYLEKFNKFQVGLSKQKLNFNFQIKAGTMVLLEGRREQPADRYRAVFGLELSGNENVKRLRDLFDELWAVATTDKKQVVGWLKDLAASIKQF